MEAPVTAEYPSTPIDELYNKRGIVLQRNGVLRLTQEAISDDITSKDIVRFIGCSFAVVLDLKKDDVELKSVRISAELYKEVVIVRCPKEDNQLKHFAQCIACFLLTMNVTISDHSNKNDFIFRCERGNSKLKEFLDQWDIKFIELWKR